MVDGRMVRAQAASGSGSGPPADGGDGAWMGGTGLMSPLRKLRARRRRRGGAACLWFPGNPTEGWWERDGASVRPVHLRMVASETGLGIARPSGADAHDNARPESVQVYVRKLIQRIQKRLGIPCTATRWEERNVLSDALARSTAIALCPAHAPPPKSRRRPFARSQHHRSRRRVAAGSECAEYREFFRNTWVPPFTPSGAPGRTANCVIRGDRLHHGLKCVIRAFADAGAAVVSLAMRRTCTATGSPRDPRSIR